VDLEKSFDRVPMEVIRWATRNLAVLSIYTGAKQLSEELMVTVNVLR